MFWFIALFVVSFFAIASMIPKPQTQPPPGFDEIQAPTAEEGREISVLFGTRAIRGPNVVWYGDYRSVAVKSKTPKK